jgi:Sulfotransferase domain
MEPEKLFLITTTQRCGSTWLTRVLRQMTNLPCVYLNCTALGFSLDSPRADHAISNLEKSLGTIRGTHVAKTHDIPSKDFDAVCSAIPYVRILTLNRDFKDVVISRYFYCRYYWPSDPSLGPLPPEFSEFLESASHLPDRLALSALARSPLLENWALQWAAFEGEFSTSNAIRLRYESMLEGTDQSRLEEFTGISYSAIEPFREIQASETIDTGRAGSTRFNREGRCGQWKEWLTAEEGMVIDSVTRRCVQMSSPRAAVLSS